MNWDEKIVEKLAFSSEKPVVLIDKWKYIRLKEIQEKIRERGISIYFAEIGFDFRIKYELDARGKSDVAIVLDADCEIPDDIKQEANIIEISASEFFHNLFEYELLGLSYDELCKLDETLSENPRFNKLTKEETKKFLNGILKNDRRNPVADFFRELENAKKSAVAQNVPLRDSAEFWFSVARKLGNLGALLYEIQGNDFIECEKKYLEWLDELNANFQSFIQKNYENLFSLSGVSYPYTIDKVQDFIAENSKNRKIAFIVIDGMNYWQWTLLKNALAGEGLSIDEKTMFTWLPSITAWVRQSLFSGEKPDMESDNKNEGELFKAYWRKKRNLQEYQTYYKNLKSGEIQFEASNGAEVAGYAINSLDCLMHGNISCLGNAQLYQNTKLWIKNSNICEHIKSLRKNNFDVYISTDHGNIDAKGILELPPNQKAVAISRSKRFARFDTDEQAKKFIADNKNFALAHRGSCVYLTDRNSFSSENEKTITHGGSHIMEVLVPLGFCSGQA